MHEHELRRFVTNLMQRFLDGALELQFVILENSELSERAGATSLGR